MRTSLNRRLVIAVLSALAVFHFVTDSLRRVSAYVVGGVKAIAYAVIKIVAAKPSDINPIHLLVAAKQYAKRMHRGERPTLSPTWRMCPSV